MKPFLQKVILLFTVFLVACQPTTLAPLPAIIPPVRVVLTPANGYFAPLIEQCTREFDNLTATVQILPMENARTAIYDLAITSENGITDFNYQLSTDTLVVIVHPSNPISGLSATEVRGIFGGNFSTWQSVRPELSALDPTQVIQVFAYAESEDLGILARKMWLEETTLNLRTSLTPGPQEMIQAVSSNPSAIGFIPKRWLVSSVKPVDTGVDTTFAVVMSTMKEPEGNTRDLMGCLQRIIEERKP